MSSTPKDTIVRVVLDYSQLHDQYDSSISSKSTNIENDSTLYNPQSRSDHTAFGVVNITYGNKYHWQLRVIDTSDQDMDIGIVKVDKIEVVS